MIKHRYITYGVYNNDVMYIGFCIALSLNNAIEIFHKNKCSVWGIYKFHQVHADMKEGLEKIEFSRVMPEECNKEIIENLPIAITSMIRDIILKGYSNDNWDLPKECVDSIIRSADGHEALHLQH